MGVNIGGSPPTTNSRGDVLSPQDRSFLEKGNIGNDLKGGNEHSFVADPKRRAELLLNWLTAGGKPQLPDISKIFAEKTAIAPAEAKASAGQGINGLFGMGSLIGDLQPIKPINQSPLQPSVPYSVVAVPGGK